MAKPEPRPSYDVVIVGGGGHGLATAYYLAAEHGVTNVAVLEKGWLGGGNTGRNTTIVRSNYLWDEAAALYEKSLRLFEGLSRTLNFNVMFSQRGVFNLGHSVHEMRDIARRVNANRLNGIDGRLVRGGRARPPPSRSSTCPRRAAIRCSAPRSSRAAASPGTMRWRGGSRGPPTHAGST